MAEVIEMPKLSDTMEEGAVAKWLKKEGDMVKQGEALVAIETDKATMEYESPEEGVLLKILVKPGQAVPLNSPIAIVGEKGEKVDVDALVSKFSASQKPAAHAEAKPAATHPAPTSSPAPGRSATPSAAAANVAPGGRVKASPLARKMATDRGVDLSSVRGSGPNGRVVVRDLASASGGGASGRAFLSNGPREDQVVPLTMMRKTIAKRLVSGKNEAPHFYLTVSANMQFMSTWRQQLNRGLDKDPKSGTKVSVNDLVLFAVAHALRRHPDVNASWEQENIRQHGGIHVAIAVALPTGLVTPVVRNIDSMTVRDIARTSRDLGTKAKQGQLQNEDYAGGTFTVSNLGMFGIEEFTAIINPPQAAILAVGAVVNQPWVDANNQIIAQQRMKMTLSCDHRVIDGAMGAAFLQTLVELIENPMMILS